MKKERDQALMMLAKMKECFLKFKQSQIAMPKPNQSIKQSIQATIDA